MQNDAVLECEYVVRFDDMDNERKLSNIALLKYLEEPGGVQTKQIFGSMLTPKPFSTILIIAMSSFEEKVTLASMPAFLSTLSTSLSFCLSIEGIING